MNFSNDKEYNKNDNKNIDFAAILTGREEVPVVDTLDTALATFQSKDNEDLKFSVKITEMSNIKEVSIDVVNTRKEKRLQSCLSLKLQQTKLRANYVKGI